MGKGKITSISKIGIPLLASLDNVLFVEGLKYNLLSISKFCDWLYYVLQQRPMYSQDRTWQVLYFQTRQQSVWDFDLIGLSKKNVMCMLRREDEKWIWYKKT